MKNLIKQIKKMKSYYNEEDVYCWGYHDAIDIAIEIIKDYNLGNLSDGYHTFNSLYEQRCILFATIVNQNKDKSWKSYKHEDGELLEKNSLRPIIMSTEHPKYEGFKVSKPENWFYNNGNFSCNLSNLIEAEKDRLLEERIKAFEEECRRQKKEG